MDIALPGRSGAVLVVALLARGLAAAAPPEDPAGEVVAGFVERHCLECHDDVAKKGGLDLGAVGTNLADTALFATWVQVHDRLRDGAMPPKNAPRPPEAERAAALEALDARLHAADRARQQAQGRARARRLNRAEYQNTLRDLLGVEGDYRPYLPEDGSAAGFDKVGAALGISPEHLEAYMAAAEAALDEVIVTGPPPEVIQKRIPQRLKSQFPVDSFRNKFAYLFVDLPDALVRLSTFEDRVAGARIPRAGRYRFRVRAYAWDTDAPVRARIRAGNPGDNGSGGVPWLVGYYDFPPEGAEVEFVVRLKPGQAIRVAPYAVPGRPFQVRHPELLGPPHGPALALEWVDMEGPLRASWPPPGHQRLFGTVDLARGGRADAERVVRAFLPRAFRRPVEEAEVAHYLQIYDAAADGGDFVARIRLVLKAALCSPNFLFLSASPGRLGDHALAARLAYFLWSSTPDRTLTDLAAAGCLHPPDELDRQVERMLDDPRAAALTDEFAGQWLDLRKINATSPDARLYPEFDELLEYAMVRETRLFFEEVLRRDLSVATFVRSDFTFLNDRLAQHYEIPGVRGVELRRVALSPLSLRGGLLAMASILKVTANGTTTSPVTRGAWVMDRLLGAPPPPPPATVPAIEPDIRGAVSIRDQLARHRTSTACAACHARIDPPGFALERFDVIGGRRDRYRADLATAPERRPVAVPARRRQVAVGLGPAVDASGAMPDGRAFRDYDEFRDLLAADPDRLVRALAGKLLTYATGTAPQYADRAAIEAIVARVRDQGRGFRSLIHAVVASPVFLQQ